MATKKRGRPAKAATQVSTAPKKRGRPPKSTLNTKDSPKTKSTSSSPLSITGRFGIQWADLVKQYGKAEAIRKYAVTYPNAFASEVATNLGISRPYVQQILWLWRKKQKNIKVVKYLNELDEVKAPANFELAYAASSGKSVKDLMDTPDPKMPEFQPKHDPVNHPSHYTQGGIETIDFIEAKQLPYNLGNVVKYITRADHKGAKLQDLEKARWYLNREISRLAPKLS